MPWALLMRLLWVTTISTWPLLSRSARSNAIGLNSREYDDSLLRSAGDLDRVHLDPADDLLAVLVVVAGGGSHGPAVGSEGGEQLHAGRAGAGGQLAAGLVARL